MKAQPALNLDLEDWFLIESWSFTTDKRSCKSDSEVLRRSHHEALFSQGNGFLSVRNCVYDEDDQRYITGRLVGSTEGDAGALHSDLCTRATYISGVYESIESQRAGYTSFPPGSLGSLVKEQEAHTMLPDISLVDIYVAGEKVVMTPLAQSSRRSGLLQYQRAFNMKTGEVKRSILWTSSDEAHTIIAEVSTVVPFTMKEVISIKVSVTLQPGSRAAEITFISRTSMPPDQHNTLSSARSHQAHTGKVIGLNGVKWNTLGPSGVGASKRFTEASDQNRLKRKKVNLTSSRSNCAKELGCVKSSKNTDRPDHFSGHDSRSSSNFITGDVTQTLCTTNTAKGVSSNTSFVSDYIYKVSSKHIFNKACTGTNSSKLAAFAPDLVTDRENAENPYVATDSPVSENSGLSWSSSASSFESSSDLEDNVAFMSSLSTFQSERKSEKIRFRSSAKVKGPHFIDDGFSVCFENSSSGGVERCMEHSGSLSFGECPRPTQGSIHTLETRTNTNVDIAVTCYESCVAMYPSGPRHSAGIDDGWLADSISSFPLSCNANLGDLKDDEFKGSSSTIQSIKRDNQPSLKAHPINQDGSSQMNIKVSSRVVTRRYNESFQRKARKVRPLRAKDVNNNNPSYQERVPLDDSMRFSSKRGVLSNASAIIGEGSSVTFSKIGAYCTSQHFMCEDLVEQSHNILMAAVHHQAVMTQSFLARFDSRHNLLSRSSVGNYEISENRSNNTSFDVEREMCVGQKSEWPADLHYDIPGDNGSFESYNALSRNRLIQPNHTVILYGHDALLFDQAQFLEETLWENADIRINLAASLRDTAANGPSDSLRDPQTALRFNMLQVLMNAGQATVSRTRMYRNSCLSGIMVSTDGLAGGTRGGGNISWDNEAIIAPFFTYTMPSLARSMIKFRIDTLPMAMERAMELGLPHGAAIYPFLTSNGKEASVKPYSCPESGSIHLHVNCDIALMIRNYYDATEDEDLLIEGGALVLLSTALAVLKWGTWTKGKRVFHIRDVSGPEESGVLVHDNYYTNMLAKQHFLFAVWVTENILKKKYPHIWVKIIKSLNLTIIQSQDSILSDGDTKPKNSTVKLNSGNIHHNCDELYLMARAAQRMALPYDFANRIRLKDASFLKRKMWSNSSVVTAVVQSHRVLEKQMQESRLDNGVTCVQSLSCEEDTQISRKKDDGGQNKRLLFSPTPYSSCYESTPKLAAEGKSYQGSLTFDHNNGCSAPNSYNQMSRENSCNLSTSLYLSKESTSSAPSINISQPHGVAKKQSKRQTMPVLHGPPSMAFLPHLHPVTIHRNRVCNISDVLLAQISYANSKQEFESSKNQKATDFLYYEPLTLSTNQNEPKYIHPTLATKLHPLAPSSWDGLVSAVNWSTFCIVAAEIGLKEKAWEYFQKCLMVDIDGLLLDRGCIQSCHKHHTQNDNQAFVVTARPGLHVSVMAASWACIVRGFGGMRVVKDTLCFNPWVPNMWSSFSFKVKFRKVTVGVNVSRCYVTYMILEDSILDKESETRVKKHHISNHTVKYNNNREQMTLERPVNTTSSHTIAKRLRILHANTTRVFLVQGKPVTVKLNRDISSIDYDAVVLDLGSIINRPRLEEIRYEIWCEVVEEFVHELRSEPKIMDATNPRHLQSTNGVLKATPCFQHEDGSALRTSFKEYVRRKVSEELQKRRLVLDQNMSDYPGTHSTSKQVASNARSNLEEGSQTQTKCNVSNNFSMSHLPSLPLKPAPFSIDDYIRYVLASNSTAPVRTAAKSNPIGDGACNFQPSHQPQFRRYKELRKYFHRRMRQEAHYEYVFQLLKALNTSSLPPILESCATDVVDADNIPKEKQYLSKRFNIKIPYGLRSAAPGFESMCALANLQTERLQASVKFSTSYPQHQGDRGERKTRVVSVFPEALSLIEDLRQSGVSVGLVSGTEIGGWIAQKAGIGHLFDVVLDEKGVWCLGGETLNDAVPADTIRTTVTSDTRNPSFTGMARSQGKCLSLSNSDSDATTTSCDTSFHFEKSYNDNMRYDDHNGSTQMGQRTGDSKIMKAISRMNIHGDTGFSVNGRHKNNPPDDDSSQDENEGNDDLEYAVSQDGEVQDSDDDDIDKDMSDDDVNVGYEHISSLDRVKRHEIDNMSYIDSTETNLNKMSFLSSRPHYNLHHLTEKSKMHVNGKPQTSNDKEQPTSSTHRQAASSKIGDLHHWLPDIRLFNKCVQLMDTRKKRTVIILDFFCMSVNLTDQQSKFELSSKNKHSTICESGRKDVKSSIHFMRHFVDPFFNPTSQKDSDGYIQDLSRKEYFQMLEATALHSLENFALVLGTSSQTRICSGLGVYANMDSHSHHMDIPEIERSTLESNFQQENFVRKLKKSWAVTNNFITLVHVQKLSTDTIDSIIRDKENKQASHPTDVETASSYSVNRNNTTEKQSDTVKHSSRNGKVFKKLETNTISNPPNVETGLRRESTVDSGLGNLPPSGMIKVRLPDGSVVYAEPVNDTDDEDEPNIPNEVHKTLKCVESSSNTNRTNSNNISHTPEVLKTYIYGIPSRDLCNNGLPSHVNEMQCIPITSSNMTRLPVVSHNLQQTIIKPSIPTAMTDTMCSPKKLPQSTETMAPQSKVNRVEPNVEESNSVDNPQMSSVSLAHDSELQVPQIQDDIDTSENDSNYNYDDDLREMPIRQQRV